jgi:hypothetical protein
MYWFSSAGWITQPLQADTGEIEVPQIVIPNITAQIKFLKLFIQIHSPFYFLVFW